MNRIILNSFLIIILCSNIFAQNNEQLFAQANKMYSEKKYEEAINMYNQLIAAGYDNSVVNYNMGDAYYRLGKIGYSILFYEKSLKNDPSNKNAQKNLIFIQKKYETSGTFQKLSLYNYTYNQFSDVSLSLLIACSLCIFILVFICSYLYLFAEKLTMRKISFFVGFVSIFIFIILISISGIIYYNRFIEEKAIVITDKSEVKELPELNEASTFTLKEGSKVIIKEQKNNWFKIEFEDGKTGWIDKNTISEI